MTDEFERLKLALAGRYTIQRTLGRGGMASVYLAHDLKHDRPVALKALRPELATALGPERFLREIAITARLEHAHILPLLDSGSAGDLLFYVMPYVAGESLRDRLTREKQLPLDDALQIARDVADALSYAHGHGILHRDIKPENILLGSGRARVADFGIARVVTAAEGAGAEAALTATGVAIGTPAYMSPEQAAGDRALDVRTDIYALGCVMYEMLAGHPPFEGPTAEAILARKSFGAAPSLRVVRQTVPAAVEDAILRALAKVPADRFGTVSQFADALARGRERPDSRSWTDLRKQRRRVFIVLAAALTLLTAAWWVRKITQPAPLSSLAVLPLANLTGDPRQQHFVDAMHDALITELAQIGALTVISRQSVLRYRESEKPIPEIARELNVNAVVEGSVFRAGDTVRLTVQLLQARPVERHLWGKTFQRDLRDVFALHSQVARAIAERIEVAVTPDELTRLTRRRPVNPAAYQAWLRGWAAINAEGSGSATERCIAQAEAAAAIDSNYAPAYVLAAECYSRSTYVTATPPHDAFRKARAAAQRAIAIDSTLGIAYLGVGYVLAAYDWDWSGAELAFQRAIRLAPSESQAHWLYGFFLAWMGRHEEAIEHARRAELLNPGGPVARQNVAMVLYLARHYDEAIEHARLTIEISPAGFAYDRLAWAEEAKQAYAEAIVAREKAATLLGDPLRKAFLARTYALAGRRDEAIRILDELMTRARTSYVPPTAFAHIYIGLGRPDEAIAWLEKAYQARDGDLVLLKTWPAFDPLRQDPRFQSLLRRMNFPP